MPRERRLEDHPDQSVFWDMSLDPVGKRMLADVLDQSIDEDTFASVLTYAANVAAKRFRVCIPRGMTVADFRQELILKIFSRVKRWRNQGTKSFKNYATDIAKNAAKDILRKDSKRPPVEFYAEFHGDCCEQDRGKYRWEQDQRLTQDD